MASDQSQTEALLNWVRTFDFSQLQNEDDVETKFVIKLFEYLGYTDQHRRGKYPLKGYKPGKPGRKPEVDNIYFAATEIDKQTPDTSLLLVEAKEPNKSHLENDIAQAEYYGDHLKVLFHVVTNGHQLKVFKRHRHHDDECIFDIPTIDLQDEAILRRFYFLLNFSVVKQSKERAVSDLTHDLYVEVSQTLHRYPDLLAQLAKGDFNSYTFREGRRIIVSKPRVAMDCQLPLVYGGGSCQIEFSNVMLRGLTCQLKHEDIVRDLLIGLHSPPHRKARGYIKSEAEGTFEVHLGQTTVLLSEQETQELCACIDIIGQAYKEELIEATHLLEAWDYEYVQAFETPGYSFLIRGFSLLSVRPWLWQLMKKFAFEFNYNISEQTNWHIFIPGIHGIHIHQQQKKDTNVTLWPLCKNEDPSNGWIDVLYYNPDHEVEFYEEDYKMSWKQLVGVQGIWTVRYTHEWIAKKFIPKVLSYYNVPTLRYQHPLHKAQEWFAERLTPQAFTSYKQIQQKQREAQQKAMIENATISNSWQTLPLLSDASKLKHLAPYLHEIQGWIAHYGLTSGTGWIMASLLREYYATFTELMKAINPTTVDLGYIEGKLGVLEREMNAQFLGGKLSPAAEEQIYDSLTTVEGIIDCLKRHVNRINEIEYEDTGNAEYISRVFIAICNGGQGFIGQDQLNKAKQVLTPLWEQSRFEERFIR